MIFKFKSWVNQSSSSYYNTGVYSDAYIIKFLYNKVSLMCIGLWFTLLSYIIILFTRRERDLDDNIVIQTLKPKDYSMQSRYYSFFPVVVF